MACKEMATSRPGTMVTLSPTAPLILAGLVAILLAATPSRAEDVHLQIISPSIDVIMKEEYKLSRYQRIRGYDLDLYTDFTFTTSEKPAPDEILDIFCNTTFPLNVTALMNVNMNLDYAQSSVFSEYLLSLAESMGYPVISWNPLYSRTMESDKHNMVLQMAPTIYHECSGMFEIFERYNWTDFSVVTVQDVAQDFLDCIELMIEKTSTKQGYLKIPRYTNIATVVIDVGPIEYGFLSTEQEGMVREQLDTLVKAKSRIILFHAKQFDALPIIDVADDMGLVGPKFGWIVTSQAIGQLYDVSRTNFPIGLLGIQGFKVKNDRVLTDIPKAIAVFKEAIMAVAKSRDSISLSPGYDCATPLTPWQGGKRLFEFMKKVNIKKSGEPPLSFMENGLIEQTELILFNVRPAPHLKRRRERTIPNAWEEVGKIIPQVNGDEVEMVFETKDIVWPGKSLFPPKSAPEKTFYRVVTKQEPPFVQYIPPDPETGECGHHAVPCTVNANSLDLNDTDYNGTVEYCCTGLCIEIMEMLAQKMNFEYDLYDVPDNEWGVRDPVTGEWNGLIKEVLDGKADMVLSAFIVNQMRSNALDFSVPFLESGITIMVSIRKGAISPTAFLEPYDIYSWILILIFSVHATGASIFIFEWLSPCGLAQGKTPLVEHKFSLFRSFWLIWAMLFGAAVSVDVPRGVSSRFLANVWALFALVFLASYTANLAAFMITIDEFYDLSGIEDWRLLNPTSFTPHFKFATIANSSSDVNLQVNYPKMHKYMSKYSRPDVESAIASLKNNSIHAFIYDANVLEFMAGKDDGCSLLTVGRWYAMSGYGIGLPRGSTIKTEMDEILLNLQYSGEIERLQEFWLAGACHAKKDKKSKTNNKIGILNFISAFILLAGGVLLGVVLLVLEHLYFKSGRKCLKKYDKCGCCALVSLSMGKSLTFEQSVFDAIDIQRKHKCKDPVCEMHLWKARHQLDMALLKVRQLQASVDEAKSNQAIAIAQPSHVDFLTNETVA